MREYKFRGKAKDGKTWIYGAYYKHQKVTLCMATEQEVKENELHLIINGGFSDWNLPANLECYEVIPETVGEYTGLHDKTGKEIYEGDIALWGDRTAKENGTAIYATVEYKSGCFGLNYNGAFHEFYHYMADKWTDEEITDDMWGELPIDKYFRACFEVIGNIHDNPELINGEAGERKP